MSLKLNRKTDYALVTLGHLAERASAEGSEGGHSQTVSAREVADAFGMPRALVMNLLKQLGRAGLVGSSRGVNGGYFLARRPDRISVSQVIEAVEGPFQFALCCADDREEEGEPCRACALMVRCPIGPSIRRLSERVEALLEAVTVQDLLDGRVDEATSNSRRAYGLSIAGAPRDE